MKSESALSFWGILQDGGVFDKVTNKVSKGTNKVSSPATFHKSPFAAEGP